MKKCLYCETETNAFTQINQASDYSGIDISLNRQGMLRVRTYRNLGDVVFDTQDIVEMRYCPYCGRPFMKG